MREKKPGAAMIPPPGRGIEMSVYLDTSTKGDRKGGVTNRRHWIYRLDMRVEGKRIRYRSKNYNLLKDLHDKIRSNDLTYEQAIFLLKK